VKVEDYDLPGLKTEDGIADIGFAWAAWIVDPGSKGECQPTEESDAFELVGVHELPTNDISKSGRFGLLLGHSFSVRVKTAAEATNPPP
jgi:hypothetical protein